MIIPVIWQSYRKDDGIIARGYWDQGLLEGIFDQSIWRPNLGVSYRHVDGFAAHGGGGAIVVLPAQHHVEFVDALNADLMRLPWVVLILAGDEQHVFPWRKVRHPNMVIWAMTPHPEYHEGLTHFLPDGFKADTPGMLDLLFEERLAVRGWEERDLAWSFMGQINHDRRRQFLEIFSSDEASALPHRLLVTDGFTQGVSRDRYLGTLLETKVAPAPGGIGIPSSFRAYEALEAGCCPILDAGSGEPRLRDTGDYWRTVHDLEMLFVCSMVHEWDDHALGITETLSGRFAEDSSQSSAWWQKEKRRLAYDMAKSAMAVSRMTDPVLSAPHERITAVVTTSPIESHPDTRILEETIESVRQQLPGAEIIIAADGVRQEQSAFSDAYHEYRYRVARLCEHRWPNTLPLLAEMFLHQARLTSWALQLVETPLILFVEHDTPIYGDIPWSDLMDLFGPAPDQLDVLRLHHESVILPDHEHLMLDDGPEVVRGVPIRRTMQWSQRPHLARTPYYRRILRSHFAPQSRTMIEDRMHSFAQSWPEDNRIGIYHPEGDIKRSWHLDGRGSEPKYEMRFE